MGLGIGPSFSSRLAVLYRVQRREPYEAYLIEVREPVECIGLHLRQPLQWTSMGGGVLLRPELWYARIHVTPSRYN